MAKTAEISHRDIITSIKKGNFAPIYILMGDEPYYIDLIVNALEENVVEDEADREFNSLVFYGADADIETVVASAQQFPVMGGRQLVILKEAQSMQQAKVKLERMEGYMTHPNRTTVLVVVFKDDSLNANSKMLKAVVKSGGIVYKSTRPKDFQLPSAVKDYCRSRRIDIDGDAANMLAEYIGAPLGKLFGEVDKLLIALGKDKKRISIAEVETYIGVSKEYNNFELVKAVSRRDYAAAMNIVGYFRSNPRQNPVVVTTSMLFGFFTKLVVALFAPDKSDRGLMNELELKNAWALTDVRTGMQHFNAAQAVNAIHVMRDFDCEIKGIGSTQNEYDLLKELMFRLATL